MRDYQSKNGLGVDGVVGPQTWAKLGSGRRCDLGIDIDTDIDRSLDHDDVIPAR